MLGVFADESKITYQDHAYPIFRNHCLNCHNADKKKGGLDLSTYTTALQGGSGGEIVFAGDLGRSKLFKVVTHQEDPQMPPKGPKIPDADLAVLRKWIEGGLLEASGSVARKSNAPKVDLSLSKTPSGKPAGPPPMPEDLLLEPLLKTRRPEAVNALAASPWAPLVAIGGQHQVVLYNTDTLEIEGVLPFPERRTYVLRFSRNGKLLLAGGGRGAKLGKVVVWDVKTGERAIEAGDEYDVVLAADLSGDQTRIALGGPSKLIKIFATDDGDLLHTIKKHTDWVTALEFSPDGALLASGDRNGGLHVWESKTGRIVFTLAGHRAGVTDVSWRSDSKILASSGEDGQVMLWEMDGGTRLRGWGAHAGGAASVKYAQDDKLVTSGRDSLVKTWTGEGGRIKEFEKFGDLALRAAFSHDGKRVIGGDWTGEVRVWSAEGKREGTLTANPPSLSERIAQDAKLLADAKARRDAPSTNGKKEAFEAEVASLEKRLGRWKAAQFNAQVAAARDEFKKLQDSKAAPAAVASAKARYDKLRADYLKLKPAVR